MEIFIRNVYGLTKDDIDMPVIANKTIVGVVEKVSDEYIKVYVWERHLNVSVEQLYDTRKAVALRIN